MTPQKKRRKRVVPSKSGGGQSHKTVYLYHDEMELIEAAADNEGISVSAYMVKAALKDAAAFLASRKR